jgi:hypothetical protein
MCHASGCVVGCSDNSVPLCLIGTESSRVRHSLASSTRVLPTFTTCFEPSTADSGLCRCAWSGGQPVDEPAHRGELLLPVRRRMGQSTCLYICGDVIWPNRPRRRPTFVATSEECPGVSAARVRVADVGREEVDIAPGSRSACSAISAGTSWPGLIVRLSQNAGVLSGSSTPVADLEALTGYIDLTTKACSR